MLGCLLLVCLVAIGLLGWMWAMDFLSKQAHMREQRHRHWHREIIAASEAVAEGDNEEEKRH